MSLLLSLGVYGLTIPLVYQWITLMMRDLSMTELYMADSPYMLRIASTFDWLLFAGLPLVVSTNVIVLIRPRASAKV